MKASVWDWVVVEGERRGQGQHWIRHCINRAAYHPQLGPSGCIGPAGLVHAQHACWIGHSCSLKGAKVIRQPNMVNVHQACRPTGALVLPAELESLDN